MIEIYGDMFKPETYHDKNDESLPLVPDAFVITTNGFVKNNGEAVMGRGCARQAAERYLGLKKILGGKIREQGNRVILIVNQGLALVSFPVKSVSEECNATKSNVVRHMQKRFRPGQTVPGWACVADRQLIVKSAEQLVTLTNHYKWDTVILPRPGCGAGELTWDMVSQSIGPILDHRFYCITFSPGM
jgi:hypothetical protein